MVFVCLGKKTPKIGHNFSELSCHMCIPWGYTLSLVPSSRSHFLGKKKWLFWGGIDVSQTQHVVYQYEERRKQFSA